MGRRRGNEEVRGKPTRKTVWETALKHLLGGSSLGEEQWYRSGATKANTI